VRLAQHVLYPVTLHNIIHSRDTRALTFENLGQHLWGHMRLLHAAGALDQLLDRKLNDVLGALLECMRMTCDQVPLLVELDSHPAALRLTAPAAAAQHHHLPAQQPATRPGHTARESPGQCVRQRLRQVASACQRPRAKAGAPPATALSASDGRLHGHLHKGWALSPAYAHKRFEYFTGGDMEGVLCQVVHFVAQHHGLGFRV